MSSAAGVTADELLRALELRGATLPAEIATFVALEACEAMLQGGPRELVDLTHVRISSQGATSLSGPACEDEPGARSLHRVLGLLLTGAGSRLPPALARLLEDGPSDGDYSLGALHDELEAALVPLNRNASRRVLARFAREAAAPVLDPREVDAALDSLLDEGGSPANDVGSRKSHARVSGTNSPLEVDLFEGMEFPDDDGDAHRYDSGSAPDPDRIPADARTPSLRPSFAPHGERELDSLRARAAELTDRAQPHAGPRKLLLGLGLILLAGVLLAVALSVRSARPKLTAASTAEPTSQAEPTARGDLVVTASTPGAQVLRFVGRAPVTVESLPVGAAHEFVATAEGHRPARVLVPTDADWEPTAEGARYEVALQLAGAEPGAEPGAEASALELGPSRLTKQVSSPSSRLGSVRVVATPRGARVYQLVGFSPRVELRDLPLEGAEELLVYREGFAPVLRVVPVSEFRSRGERRVAEVAVELNER